MRARRELMRELMQAPTRLTITQEGTTITMHLPSAEPDKAPWWPEPRPYPFGTPAN